MVSSFNIKLFDNSDWLRSDFFIFSLLFFYQFYYYYYYIFLCILFKLSIELGLNFFYTFLFTWKKIIRITSNKSSHFSVGVQILRLKTLAYVATSPSRPAIMDRVVHEFQLDWIQNKTHGLDSNVKCTYWYWFAKIHHRHKFWKEFINAFFFFFLNLFNWVYWLLNFDMSCFESCFECQSEDS